jgi:uncharacterized protein
LFLKGPPMRSLSTAVLAAACLVAPLTVPAEAQSHRQEAPVIEGTILTLSAEGSVTAAPDMAVVNLGVMTEGATAEAAMRANSQRMTALVQVLRRAGIAERDIQTSGLSVSPQYVYHNNEAPRISGYHANNQVTVRVRDLDSLGRVLDQAIAAGGNTLNGVSFGLQDPDTAMNGARQDAVREALARAQLYASAAGLRVHRIISISEGGGYAPPPYYPMPMAARMEGADMAAPPPPVAPGELETRVNLSFVIELR